MCCDSFFYEIQEFQGCGFTFLIEKNKFFYLFGEPELRDFFMSLEKTEEPNARLVSLQSGAATHNWRHFEGLSPRPPAARVSAAAGSGRRSCCVQAWIKLAAPWLSQTFDQVNQAKSGNRVLEHSLLKPAFQSQGCCCRGRASQSSSSQKSSVF